MGWWRIQGTEHQLGDVPLDALGEAVRAVVNEYQSELGRKPSREEREALLGAVLGNELPEFRCMDEGVVEKGIARYKIARSKLCVPVPDLGQEPRRCECTY